MINQLSANKNKHYAAACMSLNRLRYRTDIVSPFVRAYDPTYFTVVDLFQDFFEEMDKYAQNKER